MADKTKKPGHGKQLELLMEIPEVEQRVQAVLERYMDPEEWDLARTHGLFPQLVYYAAAREQTMCSAIARVISRNLEQLELFT